MATEYVGMMYCLCPICGAFLGLFYPAVSYPCVACILQAIEEREDVERG